MTGPRILIITSNTGGGHHSLALAIRESLLQLAPQAQVVIADIFAHLPFPLSRVGRLYGPVVQYSRGLWQLLWYLTKSPDKAEWLIKAIAPLARPTLRNLLRKQCPDAVVSVHSLCVHALAQARQELGLLIPQVTVVLDLVNIHPTWGCPTVDCCVVPTEPARQQILRYGIPAERVRLLGLPVGGRFRPMRGGEKQQLRRQLNLDVEQPVALLVGGGEGIGPLEEITQAVAMALAAEGHGQLVIICGRNEHLRQQLARRMWPIPVTVQGFVTNMPDWMGAADLIITKAGPSTIAEALVVGLPILLCGFIPGQEEGNVPFVVEQGAGVYVEKPTEIARRVGEWLRPGNPMLVQMAARARALGRPAAAAAVAEEILRLLPIR